jgi:hypothetical protein
MLSSFRRELKFTFSLRLYNSHMLMSPISISHTRQDETLEAKVRWFRSLPLSERMDLLCAFTDLILATQPKIVERRHAQPVAGRIRVLSTA